MNNHITYQQVIDRLRENDLRYAVLPLQNNIQIVISERSGRVLGPFLDERGESIFWARGAFANPDDFAAFTDAGGADLGGERLWIAPEIQYHVQDRTNFDSTYQLPTAVDPGHYELSESGPRQWCLKQAITLQAYNVAAGPKHLQIERLFGPAPDPLRGLSRYAELIDGVRFAGYEQTVTLAETRADNITSQSWVLIQVNPGGEILIPFTAAVEVTNYYEPVDNTLQTIHDRHVRLKITGQRRYKTGYKAASLTGRVGYTNRLDDGRIYLLVRNFFNNPSTIYNEEPADRPGFFGDSVHVYDDSGALGGFGELECAGQTIGGVSGKLRITDAFLTWLYVGTPDQLNAISEILLGISLTRA
jgi:hypothetical protein